MINNPEDMMNHKRLKAEIYIRWWKNLIQGIKNATNIEDVQDLYYKFEERQEEILECTLKGSEVNSYLSISNGVYWKYMSKCIKPKDEDDKQREGFESKILIVERYLRFSIRPMIFRTYIDSLVMSCEYEYEQRREIYHRDRLTVKGI